MKQATIPIESRVDIRILATLLRYYKEVGIPTISKSKIIASAVTEYALLLIKEGKVVESESVSQSLRYLEREGLGIGTRHPNPTLYKMIRDENTHADKSSIYIPDGLVDDIVKRIEKDKEV